MVGTSRKPGRVGAIRRSIKPPVRRSSDRIGPVSPLTDVVESFSLVRETRPLSFAMAIKLTPELIEEMKRVGSTARVKFSANPAAADGNVINVGEKNFRFTWSTETPVLCDIYEERQSGEGGNGLLVECGSAWRKLSVQRVLDESTQNHVKMLSEEADRRIKSRRAIVLDPRNSSMNQVKALAAAESNQWVGFKIRKEPPSRTPKPETTTAVAPHKPMYRPGLSMTTPSKGKSLCSSPLSSQPRQHGAPKSRITSVNTVQGHAAGPDIAATHNLNKISISNKETNTWLGNSDPFSVKPPINLRHADSEFVTVAHCEKYDDHVADVVDVDKDSSLDNHETARSDANFLYPNPESRKPVEEIKCYSAGHHETRERPSKRESKQRSDDKHCDEGPHNNSRKRLKGKNSNEFVSGTINLPSSKSKNTSSPDEPREQLNLGPTDQNACTNNSITLQKKVVESHNDVGLPSERSLTRFFSEGIVDKVGTSKESLYRNREMHGKLMDSSGSSRKKHSDNVVAGSRNVTLSDSDVPDESSKRKVLDCHVDDHAITQKRATPPCSQLHQSSIPNKVSETCSKSKYAEAGTVQEAIREVVFLPMNGIMKHKTVESCDSNRRKDALMIGSIDESRRKRESSSDRNNPYIKYEKNEAELKGPIKNVSQYRAYVKEYQEKYESYCSLNKILESYRDEFSNIGKDLKTYKDTDMKKYHEIMGQIKAFFYQHGEKHKRLKKIFLVLYEELQHLKQMIKDYAALRTKD